MWIRIPTTLGVWKMFLKELMELSLLSVKNDLKYTCYAREKVKKFFSCILFKLRLVSGELEHSKSFIFCYIQQHTGWKL